MTRRRLRCTPVEHHTYKTVSDHRLYVAMYRVAGRELWVGTLNLSRSSFRHPSKRTKLRRFLLAHLHYLDVLLLQEAGQAPAGWLEEIAAESAHLLHDGRGRPGQDSTPVMVSAAVDSHFWAHKLHGRRHAGPGAGPSTSKVKWLMGVTIRWGGTAVHVANRHKSASIYNPIRWGLNLLQDRRAAQYLAKLSGWVFVGGDGNALPGMAVFRPLWRIGLRSTQRRLGIKPTHGRRAIDDIYGRFVKAGKR